VNSCLKAHPLIPVGKTAVNSTTAYPDLFSFLYLLHICECKIGVQLMGFKMPL
jgi:hypothetical protein